MSHHHYRTEGFVLGGISAGPSHRYISLLTKELGFVKALARSVREEHSKLRFSLQDFTYAELVLVRGRESWKVVGAEERYNAYYEFSGKEEAMVFGRICSLLNRLLHGEDRNDYLFTTVHDGISYLREHHIEKESLKNLESLMVLRILYALGYVGGGDSLGIFLTTPIFTHEIVKNMAPVKSSAVREINRALKASHL